MDYHLIKYENVVQNFDIEIKKNKKYIFDGRFFLTSKFSGNLIRSVPHNFGNIKNDNPFAECEYDINNTIPFMSTLEGMTIKPHFNICDSKSQSKLHFEDNSYEICFINRLSL